MAKRVIEKEASVQVTQTVLGKQKTTAKKIKIRPFVTDTANVSVKFGMTIPTGDYSSVRFDVMLSCPCYVEEMLDVYGNLRDLADKLAEQEAARLGGEGE